MTTRTSFSDGARNFVEAAAYFFLASADRDGRPDVLFKGGMPALFALPARMSWSFRDYDGNGMIRSLGNLSVNPAVGLLFVDFVKLRRLRVQGLATASRTDPLMSATVGAQMIVRIKVTAIFLNCPRYIPTMRPVEPSV